MKQNLLNDLIGTNTGRSHKRAIAVLVSVVLVIFGGILLFVSIPENNVPLFNQILYIFSGVILFQTGLRCLRRRTKLTKKVSTSKIFDKMFHFSENIIYICKNKV